jgi:hypothetical protein
MAISNLASKLGTAVSTANNALSTVKSVANTASNLAGALNNLSNPAALISSLRSLNLPKGGEAGAKLANAAAAFGGDDANNDWRVRLSVPPAFSSSPVLAPLRSAGGLVFPYTPSITISGSALYDEQSMTHQNYQFVYYQNSKAEQIQVVAPFNVEDETQALYWLAAIHMLRSATKMFTGDDPQAGNPPPLLRLNGYGDYVFKNVPVVVKSFSVDLPQDVDYINTSVASAISAAGPGGILGTIAGVSSTATQLAGLAGALGKNKVAERLGKAGAIGGAIAGIGKLLSGASLPGGGPLSIEGNSWVPTKSTVNVTLQPIYSRESMRQFSLKKFVEGGYVKGGYV